MAHGDLTLCKHASGSVFTKIYISWTMTFIAHLCLQHVDLTESLDFFTSISYFLHITVLL